MSLNIQDIVDICIPNSLTSKDVAISLYQLRYKMYINDLAEFEIGVFDQWFYQSGLSITKRDSLQRLWVRLKNRKVKVKDRGDHCMAHVPSITDIMPLEVILSVLKDKRINISNLNVVFQIAYTFGIGKDKFYLSCNGHGIDSGIFKRNIDRLIKLGLIQMVKKGRKWNEGNTSNGHTNPATLYSLTFNAPGRSIEPPKPNTNDNLPEPTLEALKQPVEEITVIQNKSNRIQWSKETAARWDQIIDRIRAAA